MNRDNGKLQSALGVLAKRGWYSQRSEETQRRLATIAKLRELGADEAVYLAGDDPAGVYGLVEGSVNISFPRGDGEVYVMHRAAIGFWIGDLALFAQKSRLISLHAGDAAVLVELPSPALRRLLNDDPRLYADFYAMTYENVEITFQAVTNLSIASVEKRVADRLLMAASARPEGQEWIEISQPDLARLLAISLATLQRAIRRFAQEGLVERGYGRIKVLDPEGLRRVCLS
ncbi:Crp/Fnr family transcriptional regulator [Methyloligella sp. 2.7D]|uniref:Crp/Fnr family transcriptional regulator n=1 Tax=unclassified Methyloligella TaxID=2625955 RepID=UPI00157D27B6|nr:Crp/Fnr family transcriptional regulator [Methyloligella sp. GL2]QKP76541.1 Crp/Fnr family transcriptional regulator [Methyloligella sp. GL2]